MRSFPAYLELSERQWERRVGNARDLLSPCRVCPRECGVDRPAGEAGYCGIAGEVKVASHNIHLGEEPPLSGGRGSGTIFFTGCNLCCLFCQNYPISQMGAGNPASPDDLAEMMLSLQKRGADNINFVTPSHMVPQMVDGIARAVRRGLRLPIVYNSNSYDKVETLRLLDGIVDIYLPDFKYADEKPARELSDAPGYPDIALDAIAEMYRQAGALRTDERKIARRGVIVRHLVLPGEMAGGARAMKRLADRVGTDLDVSLMTQYFPAHRAGRCATIARKITNEEIRKALEDFERSGIERCFFQGHG